MSFEQSQNFSHTAEQKARKNAQNSFDPMQFSHTSSVNWTQWISLADAQVIRI